MIKIWIHFNKFFDKYIYKWSLSVRTLKTIRSTACGETVVKLSNYIYI